MHLESMFEPIKIFLNIIKLSGLVIMGIDNIIVYSKFRSVAAGIAMQFRDFFTKITLT